MQMGNVAQWTAAVVTTAGIIVALFKEEIIRRWRHPKLTMRIEEKYPDIVRTPDRKNDWHGWRYFIRLWISNAGKMRAENVEAFLSEILELRNGSYVPISSFIPMNLRWSYSDYHLPTIYVDSISSGMGRFCDFAAISDPTHPDVRGVSDRTLLSLRLQELAQTGEWLRQGRYKFKVQIAGSNCEPKAYWIDLHLTGVWEEDPSKMISNGVTLKVRED